MRATVKMDGVNLCDVISKHLQRGIGHERMTQRNQKETRTVADEQLDRKISDAESTQSANRRKSNAAQEIERKKAEEEKESFPRGAGQIDLLHR